MEVISGEQMGPVTTETLLFVCLAAARPATGDEEEEEEFTLVSLNVSSRWRLRQAWSGSRGTGSGLHVVDLFWRGHVITWAGHVPVVPRSSAGVPRSGSGNTWGEDLRGQNRSQPALFLLHAPLWHPSLM